MKKQFKALFAFAAIISVLLLMISRSQKTSMTGIENSENEMGVIGSNGSGPESSAAQNGETGLKNNLAKNDKGTKSIENENDKSKKTARQVASISAAPSHYKIPDRQYGKRTVLGSTLVRVTYTIDEYTRAYPDETLKPDFVEYVLAKGGGTITEAQGLNGRPIVPFKDVLTRCPADVANTPHGIAVSLNANAQIEEAVPYYGTVPVPPSVFQCVFHTYLIDGQPQGVTTVLPPQFIIQAYDALKQGVK